MIKVIQVRNGYVVEDTTTSMALYCGWDGFWCRDKNNASAFNSEAGATKLADSYNRNYQD